MIDRKREYLADNFLLRKRVPVNLRDKNNIVVDEKQCVNFSNNDYLAMATHPEVKNAFIEGVKEYGVGSGASAVVSGYFDVQQQLEQRFAQYLGRARAILFNSGYHANIGVIPALINRSDVVLSDKLCHASILDGIQLSRAKHFRHRHNDLAHLQELTDVKAPGWIITESVFSMQGNKTPLKSVCDIAQGSNAKLLVDDAHGAGVFEELDPRIDCVVTPLGKAFGCVGAIVSGSDELIETVLQFARSYRYTTALPPATCMAIMKSLEIIEAEDWRRETLKKRIGFFVDLAKSRGLQLVSSDLTPIKCIVLSDNEQVLSVQKKMMDKGFFVACIRPPTVPKGTARIRISLNCEHTEDQITQLLDNLQALI